MIGLPTVVARCCNAFLEGGWHGSRFIEELLFKMLQKISKFLKEPSDRFIFKNCHFLSIGPSGGAGRASIDATVAQS